MGKTRLLEEAAGSGGGLVLRGGASQDGGGPYAPGHRRSALASALVAGCTGGCGALQPHLAHILPELGPAAPSVDRATLYEAIRCAFAHLAGEQHVTVVLDDLQWSDEATLELLPALAEPLGEMRLLVLAAYRSDGLARDHLIRRVRHDLRRAGRLEEVVLSPLGREETGYLIEEVLGARRRRRSRGRRPRPHPGAALLRGGDGRAP